MIKKDKGQKESNWHIWTTIIILGLFGIWGIFIMPEINGRECQEVSKVDYEFKEPNCFLTFFQTRGLCTCRDDSIDRNIKREHSTEVLDDERIEFWLDGYSNNV